MTEENFPARGVGERKKKGGGFSRGCLFVCLFVVWCPFFFSFLLCAELVRLESVMTFFIFLAGLYFLAALVKLFEPFDLSLARIQLIRTNQVIEVFSLSSNSVNKIQVCEFQMNSSQV